MTLYTYVPGKAEFLDLMLDAAYQRLLLTDTTGRPWRERVTAIADENRAPYLRRPWASEMSTLRPPLGPGRMAKYEHELAALQGLGLTDLDMDDALTYLLSRVLNEDTYPLAVRVGSAADAAQDIAHDPAYHFGLQRRLDDLAALIDGRN